MKQLIFFWIVAILCATAITYLSFAFIEYSFNPKGWGRNVRAVALGCNVFVWITINFLTYRLGDALQSEN